MIAAPEVLAGRSGRCRLCGQPIIAGEHYLTKIKRIGWVHAQCGAGYRRVREEYAEAAN